MLETEFSGRTAEKEVIYIYIFFFLPHCFYFFIFFNFILFLNFT